MGTKSVLIAGAIQATNVDSLVKNARLGSDIENGNVISLSALSDVSGENEVYVGATPATASLATAIYYMVNEPINVITDDKYAGLNDDPTNFDIKAGKVFNCYKPKVGDEIILSVDGIAGSKSSNTFVVPANNTGKLTWAADATATSLGYELLETTHIEIPAATFYDRRKTAYKFRCVKA
jgi:hypothetical protein